MQDLDKYEAKVLMHRIRCERGDGSHAVPCPECGAGTTRNDSPCTDCLVKRLAQYIGRKTAEDYNRITLELSDIEQRIDELLEG